MSIEKQGMHKNDPIVVWEGNWHTLTENNLGQIESRGIVAKMGDGFSPGYINSVNMDQLDPTFFPALTDISIAMKLAESLSHSQYAITEFQDFQQQTRSQLTSSLPENFATTAVEARADSIALLKLANEKGADSAQQVLEYLKVQTKYAVHPADERFMTSLNEIDGILKNKPEYYASPAAAHIHGMAIGLHGANADHVQASNKSTSKDGLVNPYLNGRSANFEVAKEITKTVAAGPAALTQSAPKMSRSRRM